MRHSQAKGTPVERALRALSPEDAFVALTTRRVLHSRDTVRETEASARYEELRKLSRNELERLVGRRAPRYELLAELVSRDVE